MVMSSGGYLHLESHWQDIQLADHHAGSDSSGSDKLTHPVEITIDTGLDATWNYTLDANGEVDLLLPVGDFEISSEFTTIQHERMLEMEYSGNSFGVVEQGIIDVRLSYTRAINSLSSADINSTSITNATFIETGMLTAVVNEEAYDAIEFDLDIEYEGTETSDVLTVQGLVSSTADSDGWTVEVYNGTDWVSQTEVS
ncbi:MAG: hypothetical protein CM15mP2_1200 [Methanobacteriota archaeon]|nr:MAG: hypothetical protein CM15mP2_1200 [Euryarchaeota archaeon]